MSCHDPKSEFCPHAGMMAAQSESPASFAGKVAGDARLRVRAAALVALALWGLYILVESIRGHVDDFIGGTALTVGLGSAALLWASTRSLGAKTMAAKNPKHRRRRLTVDVLRSARGKSAPPNNRRKFSRPLQALPMMPSTKRKSLKAITSPSIGR